MEYMEEKMDEEITRGLHLRDCVDELEAEIKKKIIELNKLQEEYRKITGKEFKPFV